MLKYFHTGWGHLLPQSPSPGCLHNPAAGGSVCGQQDLSILIGQRPRPACTLHLWHVDSPRAGTWVPWGLVAQKMSPPRGRPWVRVVKFVQSASLAQGFSCLDRSPSLPPSCPDFISGCHSGPPAGSGHSSPVVNDGLSQGPEQDGGWSPGPLCAGGPQTRASLGLSFPSVQ